MTDSTVILVDTDSGLIVQCTHKKCTSIFYEELKIIRIYEMRIDKCDRIIEGQLLAHCSSFTAELERQVSFQDLVSSDRERAFQCLQSIDEILSYGYNVERLPSCVFESSIRLMEGEDRSETGMMIVLDIISYATRLPDDLCQRFINPRILRFISDCVDVEWETVREISVECLSDVFNVEKPETFIKVRSFYDELIERLLNVEDEFPSKICFLGNALLLNTSFYGKIYNVLSQYLKEISKSSERVGIELFKVILKLIQKLPEKAIELALESHYLEAVVPANWNLGYYYESLSEIIQITDEEILFTIKQHLSMHINQALEQWQTAEYLVKEKISIFICRLILMGDEQIISCFIDREFFLHDCVSMLWSNERTKECAVRTLMVLREKTKTELLSVDDLMEGLCLEH